MTTEIDKGQGKRGRKPKTQRRQRTPLERARDRREITKLKLRFPLRPLEQIAEDINARFYSGEAEAERCRAEAERRGVDSIEPPQLSKQMVSLDVKALEARLLAEAVEDIQTLRRWRIAELRELEEYCRERYEATVGLHTKTVKTEGGKDETTRTEEEELQGETALLRLAFACKQEIIELEGSRSPRKTALTNPEGTKPFDAFGESEELKRLAAVFTEIAGHKPQFGGV